ncbi:unnamed protein product, partial [Polarella glacialis]
VRTTEGRGVNGEVLFNLTLFDASSNGTWVNDNRVGKDKSVPVRQGDRIFVMPSARVGQQEAIGFVVLTAPLLAAPSPAIAGKELHLAKVLTHNVQCRLCKEAPVRKCITAVPCGHNFDLGCLLAWRFESEQCPCCGETIRQGVRNRVVDSVTETFLRARPEVERSALSISLLEAVESSRESVVVLEQLQGGWQ